MKKNSLVGIVTGIAFLFTMNDTVHAQIFSDVNDEHWAKTEIEYLHEEMIINGYSDGTFRSSESITRAQAASMLVEAFDLEAESGGETVYQDVSPNNYYLEEITAISDSGIMTGSDGVFRPGETLSRGQMAAVLQRALDLEATRDVEFHDVNEEHWAYEEIAAVVEAGIATGSHDQNFRPSDDVSRGHFSVFLARALDETHRPEHTNEGEYGFDREWAFRGVEVGDHIEEAEEGLGSPVDQIESKYGFTWNLYHDDYNNFVQLGIADGEIVAALSPQDVWRGDGSIRKGSTKEEVREEYGTPLEYIEKNGQNFRLEGLNKDLYLLDSNYVTFYYDSHQDDTLNAVLLISDEIEEAYSQYYPTPSLRMRESFENQSFHYTNAVRVAYGHDPLTMNERAADTARKHSQDMARQQYFDHVNPAGETPFDRMRTDGVRFRSAAENLARGHKAPVDAVEGWLNSTGGHREALLGNYHYTGVGMAFDDQNSRPYYTQLLYTQP